STICLAVSLDIGSPTTVGLFSSITSPVSLSTTLSMIYGCIISPSLAIALAAFNNWIGVVVLPCPNDGVNFSAGHRSEEHTSELQSRFALVCRRLLEK